MLLCSFFEMIVNRNVALTNIFPPFLIDEFLEPITPSILEKLVVKARKMDTTFMEGQVRPGAVPPPSDYFLGFKSPGTQVNNPTLECFSLDSHYD